MCGIAVFFSLQCVWSLFFFLFCFKQCWLLLIFINDFVHRLHHFDSLLLHWLTFLCCYWRCLFEFHRCEWRVHSWFFFHVMNLAHLVLAWHFFLLLLFYFILKWTLHASCGTLFLRAQVPCKENCASRILPQTLTLKAGLHKCDCMVFMANSAFQDLHQTFLF